MCVRQYRYQGFEALAAHMTERDEDTMALHRVHYRGNLHARRGPCHLARLSRDAAEQRRQGSRPAPSKAFTHPSAKSRKSNNDPLFLSSRLPVGHVLDVSSFQNLTFKTLFGNGRKVPGPVIKAHRNICERWAGFEAPNLDFKRQQCWRKQSSVNSDHDFRFVPNTEAFCRFSVI